jgi:hypothetical protein
MSEKPRRWFQIHLSTAIVLIGIVGLFLMTRRKSVPEQLPPQKVHHEAEVAKAFSSSEEHRIPSDADKRHLIERIKALPIKSEFFEEEGIESIAPLIDVFI